MGTNIKEDYISEDQYAIKSEEFSLNDSAIEMNGNICKEQLDDALLADPDNCGICGDTLIMPRMLHCLHVFCESCLEKKLMGEGGDAGSPNTAIVCPTCDFETKVGLKKVAALPLDVTKTNVSDVSHSVNPTCTSCTAKEIAKSRCNTCHNLLCNNCDSAHHYMRCFESHKVVALEDMRKDGIKITIHKPLECDLHSGENIIYNCAACNSLICGQCAKAEHKGHPTEGIADSELRVRQDMENLLAKSKEKVEGLMKCSSGLDGNMEELAHQRSSAKDLINETYQSYKAVLEKCKDEALEELNRLYHDRELKIMKQSDELGKTIENFEDACKYTSKLLETGTVLEMMYLRKVVASRLLALNSNISKTEGTFAIEFKSDFANFEKVIKEHFGTFITEATITTPPPTPTKRLPDLAPLNINGVISKTVALTNGTSIALPTTIQSNFEGDLTNNLQTFAQISSPPLPHVSSTPNLQGFSSIAEFNLAQLATLAETTNSAATSPTPQFNLADLLTNDTAYKNLASLAKLGLNGSDTNPAIPTNGANMLVRSTSTASLNLTNNLINGFGGVSNSTSPLLSTPEDIIPQDSTLPNILPPASTNANPVPNRTNKVSPMQIRCKFGQLGPSKGQFNSPHGFCLGLEEDIIVADTNNHRIQIFEKTGSFKFQFGIPGKDEGQLWYPRKVAVMRSTGKYVVCDRGNERSRMQIFTKNGHFLKKIAIRYIDIVAGLAVTGAGEIVAVDSVSPTVFIIHENGDLLRWFDCSDYMREPSDIAIHGKEFYVCDFKGHNVVVFNEDGQYLRRIGCENLTNFPNGIDISDAGDVLIGDSHGNRFHVAVFARDGSLISEFECPYVKVSRCCGLKITSEGYVVTLAKNNHHVLVLNTLYIL
ncbi:LOW QUALITY PROTEIN: brain tumor protein-like [Sitophilus oryzae]|uniref:LOW QUALITY PROTEIN: brain tumor protein-like n=1 Tax=Sitophilus oryzae TaxID=7048 RepID=A0A6J2Y8U8_SITOR|nr:LOW QUALITY PROTEIN: brain tumor protein-like [Sitophilus oryzae]